MMSLNLIDLLLILLVLLSALYGWHRGFILGLLDLLRWIACLLLGIRYYQPVARGLGPMTGLPEVWWPPMAFMLVVILAGALIQILGYLLLRRLPVEVHRRRANRLLGILPGFVNGLITAAIAAPLLLALPLPEALRTSARESLVANRLTIISERLEMALTPIFDEPVRQTLNLLTVRPEPESEETLKLPYTVADSKPRPDLEAKMLELVNEERAKEGLKPLAPDPELREVARLHSIDMFRRGYFSHYTPEGGSPFDRMKEAGVSFRAAGENLALGPTLTIAHNGLMNSPGHRANILRPQFGRLGIGIMDGGARGLMISQEFRD
jgi:uncharacterized protein YkwD